MWPLFVVAAALDAVIAHAWPAAGDRESLGAGLLVGLFFSLLAIVLCSRPLGALLRRVRPDMPATVARNYGGSAGVLTVTAVLLALGLAHRSALVGQQRALRDAVVRAQAFIGDRAPAEFRVNATHTDTYTIEPGAVYRVCVLGRDDGRFYCVIVRPRLPFDRSVVPAGSEPNAVLAQGTG